MTKGNPRCMWCDEPIPPSTSPNGAERLYCSDAHRAKYKRAHRAMTLADLVEKLGEHVDEGGIFIYKELVDHLAGKVNEEV